MRAKKWMPMYWGDYMADTGHLNTTQHGAYLLLIAHYWSHGSIPHDDDERLARIVRCDVGNWRRHLKKPILEFFKGGGGIQGVGGGHPRLDREIAKAEEISAKRSIAANSRYAIAEQKHTQPQPQPQRRRKTPVEEPPEFVDFWNSVPRREGKHKAIEAYLKAVEAGGSVFQINAAAKQWARRELDNKTEDRYIAMPATWLNQKRFEDYHQVTVDRATDLVYDEETKRWRWKDGCRPENQNAD